MLDRNTPVCEICNKSFKTIYGYKEHLFKHINIPSLYYCPSYLLNIVCLKRFSDMKKLSLHIFNDHMFLNKKLSELTRSKNYKDMIRLKIYIYFQDFYNFYGGRNYLLNGGMCLRCLRYPKRKIHRCIKHSIDLTFCLFCNKRLGTDNIVDHSLSKYCIRQMPEFFKSSLCENTNIKRTFTSTCDNLYVGKPTKVGFNFENNLYTRLFDDMEIKVEKSI